MAASSCIPDCVMGLMLAGLAIAVHPDPLNAGEIRWRNGATVTPQIGRSDIEHTLTDLLTPPAQRSDVSSPVASRRHFVVQYDWPLSPQERAEAEQGGMRLLRKVGPSSYFAAIDHRTANPAALARVGPMSAVMRIERDWKLHSMLTAASVPSWSVVSRHQTTGAPEVAAVCVLFHPDVPLKSEGVSICKKHGATIRSTLSAINGVMVELPVVNLTALADEDSVQWVEPPLPRMSAVNDGNRERTQAELVQASPYDLTGAGVTVMVYDVGTGDATHPDFGGRLHVRDSSGRGTHATHVAGTIGGDGINSAAWGGSPRQWRGMAPGVTLEAYGNEDDMSGIFFYTNPGDIWTDYRNAMLSYGATIANNSLGTNTCRNGFPCEITGDYGATDVLIDSIVRGGLGTPFRVIWANGNERSCLGCPNEHRNGYHSTAPPACAKNHIAVGAVNSNDDSMTEFSSWGPADDGRLKPDVVAPGCQSNGDMGVTSTVPGGGYLGLDACGTSMAAPTVTGIAALMLQDYRTQYPGRPDFRNSTLKILLAHNAVDLGNVGPDYQFGYGSVRAKDTIDLMRTGRFREMTLDQGGSVCGLVQVTEADIQAGRSLKVTLAWDDVPGVPNVVPALVNDLDLRVYSPSGTRYYPWTLDPTPGNEGNPAVRTQEDHINNIEQVVVDPVDLSVGVWRIEVYGYNIPDGPQPFSVCASPALAMDCDCNLVDDQVDIAGGNLDCDGDGILSVCEGDCDGDGRYDDCEIASGESQDFNQNGEPDGCDIDNGIAQDCNGNGVPDLCDLASGSSQDVNGNYYPDECETIRVDSTAPGPRHNGATWATAYPSLQQALQVARDTGVIRTILVAKGTYKSDEYPKTAGDRSASFEMIDGVSVFGGFAGYGAANPDERGFGLPGFKTILSGDIGQVGSDADNSYHVVTAGSSSAETRVGAGTILDGFTITGGNADQAGDGNNMGAGVYQWESSATISRCAIAGNRAAYCGGGICTHVVNTGCAPSITNCVLADNHAGDSGGAVANQGAILGVSNCTIVNNTVDSTSATSGGGISSSFSCIVDSCILWGNAPNELRGTGDTMAIVYSDIQGARLSIRLDPGASIAWGIGNVAVDPHFVDAANGDYRLSDSSPCIDMGRPAAAEGDTDADGQPRVQNCRTDIGAYESAYVRRCAGGQESDACQILHGTRADCNGNGIPDDCDIADQRSSDCYPDGIGNGVPDECDQYEGMTLTWPRFDYDHDCDVDQEDFGRWQYCFAGQGIIVDSECADTDADGDGDVDGTDFEQLAACYSGPAIQPYPNCEPPAIPDTQSSPPPVTPTAWRSLRWHPDDCTTGTPYGIPLDPLAAQTAATIEPRSGECQAVEVDFSNEVYPYTSVLCIVITDENGNPGSMPTGVQFRNSNHTLRIVWGEDKLLDQKCYLIDISQAIAFIRDGEYILIGGDGDCGLRTLAGDVDEDAVVTTTDVNAVTAQAGQTIDAATCRYGVNVDGAIGTSDTDFITARLGNTLSCSGGGAMMMAAGASSIGTLTATEDALNESTPLTAINTLTPAGMRTPSPRATARVNVLTLIRQGYGPAQSPNPISSTTTVEATAEIAAVEPLSSVRASAAFLVHGTKDTSVTLPAQGGRIAVDMVVTADGPIAAYEGRPAIDAVGVASLDASSAYRPDLMFSVPNVNAAGELLSAEPVSMALDLTAAVGPLDQPSGSLFAARATIGGLTTIPLAAGTITVATLTIDVAGVPGEYHLSFADGFVADADGLRAGLTSAVLRIIVGQ